jgi:hypothetical protein
MKINNLIFAMSLTMSTALNCAHADPKETTDSVTDKASSVAKKVGNATERGLNAAAKDVRHGVKAAADGVERGAKATRRGIEHGANATVKGVTYGAEAAGRAVDHVAEKVGGSSAAEK